MPERTLLFLLAAGVSLLFMGLVLVRAGEGEPAKIEAGKREKPPIDRNVPEKLETATFGLG